MREIKFRAYSNIRGMVEVKGIEFIKKKISTPSDNGQFWVDDFCDMELMQFTGLLDKNGKEIYEGDIMCPYAYNKNPKYSAKVIFLDGGFMLSGGISSFRRLIESLHHSRKSGNEYEIIGNIYENPELLKDNQ